MIEVIILKQGHYLLVTYSSDLFESIFQHAPFDLIIMVSLKSKHSGLLAFVHFLVLCFH